MRNNLLKFKPIQKLVKGVGKDVKRYFGKDPGCVIGLGDDGVFYGLGFYQWLKQQKKDLTFTTMDGNGQGLEEEKVRGRKVLIVDNDIISGKSYKRAMETMRTKKATLKIKDIKFGVLCDRVGLADFSVEDYSAFAPWSLERLDGIDLKIIQALSEDGRKSFVEIAREIGLSPVGVKNRVENLINQKILKIQAGLNIEKFHKASSTIGIEADPKTTLKLIEKFKKSPLVYNLVETSGHHNLIVDIVAPDVETINHFVAKEIRAEPGVIRVEADIGDLPIIPRIWNPPII